MRRLLLLFLSISLLGGNALGMKRKRDLDDDGRPAKRRKKPSIYAQYLQKDGLYHCSDCSYKTAMLGTFKGHLCSKRHGHLKEKEKQKQSNYFERHEKKEEPFTEDINALFEEISLQNPVFEQQEEPNNLFYALSSNFVGLL